MFKNFNSIKVQLELQPAKSRARSYSFQFHKGTIRTGLPSCLYITSPSFQFHKGTIRTAGLSDSTSSNTYFNSIKVQLEPVTVVNSSTFTDISIP